MDNILKENEKIKEEVLKKVKPGQLINYKEFLNLYKLYEDKLSEVEFASILNISYNNHNNMRNRGTHVRVLKSEQRSIKLEDKEKIKEEVLKKVKPGQLINYKEFLSLYKSYKDKLSEVEFANILNINYSNYNSMRKKGTRARLLKNEQRSIKLEDKEKIKEEVLKKVKPGQLINYKEFLSLYEPYEDKLSEVEFANILSIGYSNYNNMRNKGTRARILKKEQKSIELEDKEKIKEEVLKKVKPSQLINYKEFLSLYKSYEDKLSEVEFASILNINYSNYNSMRNRGTHVRVLKNEQRSIKLEDKEKIKEEVLKKVKPGHLTNYKEFLSLYKSYEDKLSEVEFASILNINYSNYESMRKKGTRARILKNEQKSINLKGKEKIKEEVLKKVKIGQVIDYKEFLSLYRIYKDKLSEVEFASILGISHSNYNSIRNKGTRAIVRDYLIQKKINRVKHVLIESKYYSKTELEELAKKYDIELEVVLQYIFGFKSVKNVSSLLNSLEIKGQLWIGYIKCSKKFVEKYAQYMIESGTKISNKLTAKYKCDNIKDDIVSDSIMYIIEKCGNIEKNYLTEEQIKIAIKAIIIRNAIRLIKRSHRNKKYSIFRSDFLEETSIFDRGIKDTNINVEEEVIQKTIYEEMVYSNEETIEESCLRLLRKYLEFGYNEEKAMEEVSKYVGIDIKTLLKLLREYMISKQQVKETSGKSYILY